MSFKDKNMIYDNNGNMLSVTNSCGTTTYDWDVRNRLVGIDGYKPDCSPLTATFKYNALGRRIEKTVNGKIIQYLYDGSDIIQEIENGVVSTNYIRTLNIDEPLARIKADGTLRYYQTDALGSVIALTDENSVVKSQYSYDPFGNVTVSGEPSDNPFQYTDRENDGTGLYYYRARYYSPELQRFISEDPIGLAGGVNQFTYVGNNPVNFVDPFGLIMPRGFWTGGGPGGYGTLIGRTVGATIGGVIGGYIGVNVGMDIGFAIGASIGLGGGPLGSLGGGIVVGLVGGVAGGLAGGFIGGQIGAEIGGLFDPACAGQLNCNEPTPPVQPAPCH
jgi:RHS repeat-associated protein